MFTDAREHPIGTDSESAGRALSGAIESFVSRRSDVMPQLQEATAQDERCPLAHALRGLMITGLRKQALEPAAAAALDSARALAGRATPREIAYVDALAAILSGFPERAVDRYADILRDDPNDLLALTLAQGELFWTGDMRRAAALSEFVQPHWTSEVAGYPSFLAIRAFDLEETGRYEEAEEAGRRSVELDPANVWGAHAIAHVLLMQHRVDEGLEWLDAASDHWSEANQLKLHLWWHQCLFHLERGDHAAALSIHDSWLRNHEQPLTRAMPDFYLDLQNGASLLWRLEARGVDVGERWSELADAAEPRHADLLSPFTSAHMAMILAAAGRARSCEDMIARMSDFADTHEGALAEGHRAAVPAARACRLHRAGDHAGVLATLMPCRASLWRMGGSHAQRELFFQLMHDSARRLGRRTEMALLDRDLQRLGFLDVHARPAYGDAEEV